MDTKTAIISTGIIGAVVTGALIFWNWMNPKFEDLDKEFGYVEDLEVPVVEKETEVSKALTKALKGGE